MRVGRGEALDDLLRRQRQVLGEFGDGRGPVEALGERLLGPGEGDAQFLQPPRHVDGPGGVAEVPAYLAQDGGDGEGGELHAVVDVEAVDRLDQADRADLQQVVGALAVRAEAADREPDQRQVHFDQGGAHVGVLPGALLQGGESCQEHPGELPGVGRCDLPGVLDAVQLREVGPGRDGCGGRRLVGPVRGLGEEDVLTGRGHAGPFPRWCGPSPATRSLGFHACLSCEDFVKDRPRGCGPVPGVRSSGAHSAGSSDVPAARSTEMPTRQVSSSVSALL